jgi:hypothetical protein
MSTTYDNITDDQWDPKFMITFQDRSFRRVHSKFLEAAARDRRTGEIIALDSNGKLQKVTKIDVIPPKYR